MHVDTLNTPERIKQGIESTSSTMLKIDEHLGDVALTKFSQSLSALFAHQNPDCEWSLATSMGKKFGSKFCIYLTSACIEFTTAWNCIRIGRVPACMRSCRVATEFVAAAVLLVMPKERLLAVECKQECFRKLRKNRDKSVWDLVTALKDAKGEVQQPILRSTDVFNIFMKWIEAEPEIPSQCFIGLQDYRNTIHHPFSHGSTESWSQHFLGMEGNVAGGTLSSDRLSRYIEAATGVGNIVDQFRSILDAIHKCSWWDSWKRTLKA